MGFLTRLLAGFVAASTLGAGLAGTANAVDTAGAASDTTGAVTTTADDTGGRTVLDCRQSGEGATGPYADKFCWIDWSNLPLDSSGKPTPVRINVPGGHIDADATITHTDNAALTAKDYTGSKWSRLTSAYKLTGNTALAFSGRMGRQDPAASVTFSNVTPSADRTDTGVNVLKDFQLAFGDAEVMSGGVLQGHDVYERTDIESDKTLEKLGMIGSGDPNQSYSKANTGYGTTHVTLAGGPKGATDDANKDSKGAAVVGAKQASRFKVSFGQVNQHWDGWGSAIAVGVYMPYLTAYPLTYDKNSSDAAGEVPSNQRGKENTVQPAKSKTTGTVKTVADTSDGLPTELVNGDFEYPGADVLSQNLRDKKRSWWGVSRKDKMVYESDNPTKWVSLPSTFDSDRFAWDSSEAGKTSGVQEGSSQWHTNEVELQRDSRTGNMYAELSPYQAQSSIRQYIRTTPGALYKVRLKHASLSSEYLDKMQVLIGADGNEQPVRMTRVESQNGLDATGKATASTTISTHASNKAEISWGSGLGYHSSRNHDGQWATYEGVYVATSDVTVFTFKSVDSPSFNTGNLLDDVVFTKAYKLTYDKNSADASGQVPSNQRGKENTTQPAKTKTSGTVKTVADTNASLPDHLVNGDFSVNYHDQWKDSFGGWTSIDPNAGKTLHATSLPNGSSWKWTAINGWDKSKFGWTSTQKADSKQLDYGNVLDDIVFDKAYRLTYDKNSSDATGEVPSNQRGRENTTQPAKDKTSGTVRLASDDDVVEYAANGLPKQIMNGDFDHDWRNIVGQSKMSEKYNFANIDPAHGDVEISGALNNKGEASKQWVHLNGFDASQFGWKSNQTDTRVDGRGGIVEIQRSRANDNMYAEITASQADTYLYQDIDTAHDYPTVYTVKLRYAHRNGTINSNEKIQILVGAPGHEQPVEMTRIASDRGNKLGEKSTTVNAPNTDGWLGSWDTFQGSVVVPAGQNVSRFTFKSLGSIDGISGNLIDDVQFKLAYKLSYDKNANDASGSVPSDETANTVKQAKAKTTGTVRAVADTAANTTQPAKSETDGKVSDLVQRTTTHEDGSVTVKTIDTSTDVVSGCQVYYPAGQRITLATMAKDDDCWDSSMLSRPGHTQLGWNQDRNATQAQAQVTMVEGGMTVFAVWVGNPVLTYDTNKPSTWSGQMPSTPASVSVAYNTAAADGSGWRAGDTTKIRGYRFLGWYTGPQDNAGLYDWTRPLTGSVTVYAHWQRLQANVVYNANGGTGSHPNTTGWQYSDVTIPGDTSKSFKRDKYVFKGWGTKPGKADVVYKDGSKVALQDKDITLYAQWQEVPENFVETGGIGLPIAIAGGVLLLMFGIGSTVMLTRRMNGHGMPDDE